MLELIDLLQHKNRGVSAYCYPDFLKAHEIGYAKYRDRLRHLDLAEIMFFNDLHFSSTKELTERDYALMYELKAGYITSKASIRLIQANYEGHEEVNEFDVARIQKDCVGGSIVIPCDTNCIKLYRYGN